MATPPANKKSKLDNKGKIGKDRTVLIDRDGNLKLVVGPDAVQMQVDANALRRASKVLKCMLFGPFSEAHQTENWTVQLPEDDPEALRIIFHAIHGNFGNVPRALTLSKLYEITIMADKYAMTGSLRPWVSDWTVGFQESGTWKPDDKKNTSYEDLQSLIVLYHLGTFKQFECVFISLMLHTEVGPNGQLLFRNSVGVDHVGPSPQSSEWEEVRALPGKAIDFARSRRLALIGSLLDGLTSVFASCTQGYNNANTERRCRSTALGLMIQCLVYEKLWPIPQASEIRLSVAQLSGITSKIREDLWDKVLYSCSCASGKRGSTGCKIQLPWICDGHELLPHVEFLWIAFKSHFQSREAANVSES